MSKSRIEAFSDGVFAILITILVLEFHPVAGPTRDAVAPSNRTNAIINHLPHLLFLRRYLVAFPPRLLYSC